MNRDRGTQHTRTHHEGPWEYVQVLTVQLGRQLKQVPQVWLYGSKTTDRMKQRHSGMAQSAKRQGKHKTSIYGVPPTGTSSPARGSILQWAAHSKNERWT